MPKVLCKLPNATSPINGVKFVTHRDGMVSEEIDAAVANRFATIPGYEIHTPGGSTDLVAEAVLEASRNGPQRIGPTEPHPDMVICPACTSQFVAIPENVQTRLRALEKAVATSPATPPASGGRKPAASTAAKPTSQTPPAAPAPGVSETPPATPPTDGKPDAADPTF